MAALINFIHYKKNGWDIHIQEVVTEDDSVQSSNNESISLMKSETVCAMQIA